MSSTVPARRRRDRRKPLALEETANLSPPVWPGVEGGCYRPLSAENLDRMHATVLDLLERIGLSQAIPSMIELVCARGGRLTDDGRLLFPRALVEDVIANACKSFVMYGRGDALDLEVSGTRVHVGSGGAAPSIIDIDSGRYRETTLKDLYDAARLVDTLDNIHFFHRSLVARDCPDAWSVDLNTA